VDPVTGLSRRQLVMLALLVPLGIVASTVATVISEHARGACPDDRNGCSTSEAGEPVVVGLMLGPGDPGLSTQRTVLDRRVQVDVVRPGCSVADAAFDARDLADDPPAYPPAAVVLADLCEESLGAVALILDDEGVPSVGLGDSRVPEPSPRQHLTTQGSEVPRQVVLDRAVEAISRVAIKDGGRVVIPLSALREALLAVGFTRG
jgi:hypothetical protein